MKKEELQRLIKVEERIKVIATENLGLQVDDIEWDIIPPTKMIEIMAYRLPTQISNWKFGRDYEKKRTIYERVDSGLPYEVVVNTLPPRAYLMETNPFSIHALVIAHVYGHVALHKVNKYFANCRKDILDVLAAARDRFLKYETMYGVDAVEEVIDVGHSLQMHSTPFFLETEDEVRKRVFEQEKTSRKPVNNPFRDLTGAPSVTEQQKDIEFEHHQLWQKLVLMTPPEPMPDILRYLIDHAVNLADWQRDILEVLRIEGMQFWPFSRTQFLNEGFATIVHEKIMNQLFQEGILNSDEHGQFNYSNSLVQHAAPGHLNPYHIGSTILRDIEKRWDYGRHGFDYDNCESRVVKDRWDTGERGKGWEKIKQIIVTYTDWALMKDFLHDDLVNDLNVYVHDENEKRFTKKEAIEGIKHQIIDNFMYSYVPDIQVVNGNYMNSNILLLKHMHTGMDLDVEYTKNTLKLINKIWKDEVRVSTMYNGKQYMYICKKQGGTVELKEEDIKE